MSPAPVTCDEMAQVAAVQGHAFYSAAGPDIQTAGISSPAMLPVITTVRLIATTDAPVLITGESGTGKELVARAIHEYSARAAQAFARINCAALPEHLLESELFGYEAGAFNGAAGSKPGLFESATRGTLFLDEIGELGSRIQAKLLGVLDGQAYYRLGGTQKYPTHARIVAATHLPLELEVAAGRFRCDLYHRLDVLHVRVPPLRERLADIAPLAAWFLRSTGLTLSPAVLAVLRAHQWPGNVRELKNVLAKASLSVRGSRVEVDNLPPGLLAACPGPLTNDCSASYSPDYSLGGLEENTICSVLRHTGGHQQRAADLLGISRRTLIRKLKQYRSAAALSPSEPSHGGLT